MTISINNNIINLTRFEDPQRFTISLNALPRPRENFVPQGLILQVDQEAQGFANSCAAFKGRVSDLKTAREQLMAAQDHPTREKLLAFFKCIGVIIFFAAFVSLAPVATMAVLTSPGTPFAVVFLTAFGSLPTSLVGLLFAYPGLAVQLCEEAGWIKKSDLLSWEMPWQTQLWACAVGPFAPIHEAFTHEHKKAQAKTKEQITAASFEEMLNRAQRLNQEKIRQAIETIQQKIDSLAPRRKASRKPVADLVKLQNYFRRLDRFIAYLTHPRYKQSEAG